MRGAPPDGCLLVVRVYCVCVWVFKCLSECWSAWTRRCERTKSVMPCDVRGVLTWVVVPGLFVAPACEGCPMETLYDGLLGRAVAAAQLVHAVLEEMCACVVACVVVGVAFVCVVMMKCVLVRACSRGECASVYVLLRSQWSFRTGTGGGFSWWHGVTVCELRWCIVNVAYTSEERVEKCLVTFGFDSVRFGGTFPRNRFPHGVRLGTGR